MKSRAFLAALIAAGSLGVAACGSSDDTSAAAGTVAASCTPAHTFSTMKKGTLTVSSTDYPPFLVVDKSGSLGGVDGALLAHVAKLECLKLKLVKTTANGLVPSVVSGRADLSAAYAYRTAERAKTVGLTDPLYLSNVFLVSKDGKVKTVDDLQGKTIGTTGGNSWNEELPKIPGAKVKVYDNEKEWLQDLELGRLAAAVDAVGGQVALKTLGYKDIQYVLAPASKLITSTVTPAQVGWPVTKSNAGLLDALNADIAQMHQDGTIAGALQKFGLNPVSAKVGSPALL